MYTAHKGVLIAMDTDIPAAEPCLSPLASFLNAYEIVIGRLHKYCPFIASIAASEASKLAKLMNAKPLEFPVSGSRIICKECASENLHIVSHQRQGGWTDYEQRLDNKKTTKGVVALSYSSTRDGNFLNKKYQSRDFFSKFLKT